MRLADGRQVPDLPLDRAKVERCRTLADRITDPVLESVRRHTTVSIERTVLRLLGLHDAGPRGIPLVNLAVDALQERGLLGRGAAYWLGYVLRRGAGDPIAAVERLAALPA
ncbi:MAG TPA: D-ornithine 4,5-aminomutase subunit OraS, partial [Anaeromyxobacter sp.]|nr:D-ornithine 4,5-aminomutase subunit OraS [Anaeromyxobacter sp.]